MGITLAYKYLTFFGAKTTFSYLIYIWRESQSKDPTSLSRELIYIYIYIFCIAQKKITWPEAAFLFLESTTILLNYDVVFNAIQARTVQLTKVEKKKTAIISCLDFKKIFVTFAILGIPR